MVVFITTTMHGLHALIALPRSTQPSTCQFSGWVMVIKWRWWM